MISEEKDEIDKLLERVKYLKENKKNKYGIWFAAAELYDTVFSRMKEDIKVFGDKYNWKQKLVLCLSVIIDHPRYIGKELQCHLYNSNMDGLLRIVYYCEMEEIDFFISGKSSYNNECFQINFFRREDCKSIKSYRGSNWRYIRTVILERDDYTCQICGEVDDGYSHHVHHIVPWHTFNDKFEANKNDNLITLCNCCHKKYENSPESFR